MMKFVAPSIAAAFLFLTACGSEDREAAPASPIAAGSFTSGERSGLCVAPDGEAAFILYGSGDANCMAEGRIERGEDDEVAFVPRGDERCRLPIEEQSDDLVRFGDGGDACNYYCGGDARLAGRQLERSDTPVDLRDPANDAICPSQVN